MVSGVDKNLNSVQEEFFSATLMEIIAPQRIDEYSETITQLSRNDGLREALERSYADRSLSAQIQDDRTNVLKIINQIRELAGTRQFSKILSLVQQATHEINAFHHKYKSEPISQGVTHVNIFETLQQVLADDQRSLDRLINSAQGLVELNRRQKAKHVLQDFAKSYELMVFEMKDHLDVLPLSLLSQLLDGFEKLRDSDVAELSSSAGFSSGQYQSKLRIWTASCTIITYIEKKIQATFSDIELFDSIEQARLAMPMLSQSEVNDFLVGLDNDWHKDG
jgi:hypothetical protein